MTNYARFGWFMAICDQIYGQKWPDLWQNKIAGMAIAMVATPDFTSMSKRVIKSARESWKELEKAKENKRELEKQIGRELGRVAVQIGKEKI